MTGKVMDRCRCKVVLLDNRVTELTLWPHLVGGELMDMVASHCSLKEKEFFGLAFLDETGHYSWLQMDRSVLEHDFPKPADGTLVIYFLVKFYVESVNQLQDPSTIELFYLQARNVVYKGQIEMENEISLQLAAYAMQIDFGDFSAEAVAHANLLQSRLMPEWVAKEISLYMCWQDEVLKRYVKLEGQARSMALHNYMRVVETQPMYGVHYFEVWDKSNVPWWLGVSWKGIMQYQHHDRHVPRRIFPWKQLENLYFRDRKFSIEVHDPVRHSIGHTGKSGINASNVSVYVWFGKSQSLTKSIWQMAIAQHQFYLDRKHAKMLECPLTEVDRDVSKSCASLSVSTASSTSDLGHRGGSAPTLYPVPSTAGTDDGAGSDARADMIAALRARKSMLEAKLREKEGELQLLCCQEAELAAKDFPSSNRRYVGTAFALPPGLVNKIDLLQAEPSSSLELEYEIQKRIVTAAHQLANESTAKRRVRHQRKLLWQQSLQRLHAMEEQIQHGIGAENLGHCNKPWSSSETGGVAWSNDDQVRQVYPPTPGPQSPVTASTSTPSNLNKCADEDSWSRDLGLPVHYTGMDALRYQNKYERSLPLPDPRGTLYNLSQQCTSHAFKSLDSLGEDGILPHDTESDQWEKASTIGPIMHSKQASIDSGCRRRKRCTNSQQNKFGSLDRRKPSVVHSLVESRSLDRLDVLNNTKKPVDEPDSGVGGSSQATSHNQSHSEICSLHNVAYTGLASKPPIVPPKVYVDSYRRPKEKEWYETSLDSPLPLRKIKSPRPSTPISPVEALASPAALALEIPQLPVHEIVEAESALPFESPKNHLVVEVGRWQPYREITKPFEMADFYKYSTKYRKQKQLETEQPNPLPQVPNSEEDVSWYRDHENNTMHPATLV